MKCMTLGRRVLPGGKEPAGMGVKEVILTSSRRQRNKGGGVSRSHWRNKNEGEKKMGKRSLGAYGCWIGKEMGAAILGAGMRSWWEAKLEREKNAWDRWLAHRRTVHTLSPRAW